MAEQSPGATPNEAGDPVDRISNDEIAIEMEKNGLSPKKCQASTSGDSDECLLEPPSKNDGKSDEESMDGSSGPKTRSQKNQPTNDTDEAHQSEKE